MNLAHRAVLFGLKTLTRLLARVDDEQLRRVPRAGPLILVTNHINLLEVPLVYTHLLPRPVTCWVASVRWETPFYRWLLDGIGMIPVRRGEADVAALRRGLARLAQGWILIVSPEGTRSETGRLQRAKAGIVPLALRSGAPLMPVVFYGHEGYADNVRRLRRSDFHIVVGEPFRLEACGGRVTREVRQAMADEVMGALARLLPDRYRGVYADAEGHPARYAVPVRA